MTNLWRTIIRKNKDRKPSPSPLLNGSALHGTTSITRGMEMVLEQTDRHNQRTYKSDMVDLIQLNINHHTGKILDRRYNYLAFKMHLPLEDKNRVCGELQQWVTLLSDIQQPLNEDGYTFWAGAQVATIVIELNKLLEMEGHKDD